VEDPEDIVQQVLARLIQVLRNYNPAQGPLEGYLRTCIRHEVIDALRRAGREPRRNASPFLLEFTPGPAPEPLAALIRAGAAEAILACLPGRVREVARLRYVEELSRAETARRLKIPLPRVSRLLLEASELIRRGTAPPQHRRAEPAPLLA